MAKTKSKSAPKPRTSKKKSTPKKPAASAPKAEQAASAGDQAARVLIAKKDVIYLAGYADECMNKAGNITSGLGQEISTYAKKGLDAVAFRMVLRLRRMGKRDPLKLRSVLDNYNYYSEVLDIENLAATTLPGMEHPATTRKNSRKKKGEDAQGTLPGTTEEDENKVTHLDEHRERTNGSAEPEAEAETGDAEQEAATG